MNRGKFLLLLVEDEVLIAMEMKRCLENDGYKICEIVTTGQAAVDSATAYMPDIILMDIGLDQIEAAVKSIL